MNVLLGDGILIVLVGSLVPLFALALTTGVVTAIQSIFQIQEASLVHLVRILSMSTVIYFAGTTFHALAIELLVRVLRYIEVVR